MMNKITDSCINKIQDCLRDYVIEHGNENKNRKFTCFNKQAHKHKDEDPSASIVPGTNGRYWTCFGCRARGDILKAVQYKEGIQGFNNQVRFLSERYNIQIEKESCEATKSSIPNYRKEVTAIYYYEEESGNILYKICRREWRDEGKRKKDFIAYAKDSSNWNVGIKNTRHIIYKLPQVLKSIKADEIVFFVEGEKCVEQIIKLGLVGTTTAFGARGFLAYSKEYASSFRGANVVILPDNDESGQTYTAAILGYVCGLFLKEKLKRSNIQYNHLLIEGESSSGKSSAVKYVITPILSMEDGILNAAQCTDFALNKTASSSNFIPLILEEYKPHIIGKNKVDLISGVMRNSYDNYKGIKGVATLDKNRCFIPRASVILSGEVGIEETANVGRSLRVIFATSYFDEVTKESIEKLKDSSSLLNKLGRSLLKEGLKMEEKKVKEIQSAAFEKLISNNIKNDRVKNSIANCILGIALLKSVFDDMDLDMKVCTGFSIKDIILSIEKGAYEDLLDSGSSNKTVIEQNFETMNRMAANNELLRNIDYDAVRDLDGDLVLRLNYTSFYDRFVKYCREYNVTHEVMPLSSFKKQLSNMQYCKCYNKPVNFSVRAENPKDKKTFRSAVIYINKLREKNVDIDFMVDDDMGDLNLDK